MSTDQDSQDFESDQITINIYCDDPAQIEGKITKDFKEVYSKEWEIAAQEIEEEHFEAANILIKNALRRQASYAKDISETRKRKTSLVAGTRFGPHHSQKVVDSFYDKPKQTPAFIEAASSGLTVEGNRMLDIPAVTLVLALRMLQAAATKSPPGIVGGLEIQGVNVTGGPLDLYNARFSFPVRFRGCRIVDGITLHHARLQSFDLSQCVLGPILGTYARFDGNVRLVSSIALSVIDFGGSEIRGVLDASYLKQMPIIIPRYDASGIKEESHPKERGAFNLSLSRLNNEIRFNDAIIMGSLVMLGCEVNGYLFINNARIFSRKSGQIYLSEPEKKWQSLRGRAEFDDTLDECVTASIGSANSDPSEEKTRATKILKCWVEEPNDPLQKTLARNRRRQSLCCDGAEFSGRIYLKRSKFFGQASFKQVRIDGALRASKAEFMCAKLLNESKWDGPTDREPPTDKNASCLLDRSKIGSDLDMAEAYVEGCISMIGIKVDGDVHMRGLKVRAITSSPSGAGDYKDVNAIRANESIIHGSVLFSDPTETSNAYGIDFKALNSGDTGTKHFRIIFQRALIRGDFVLPFEPTGIMLLRAKGMTVGGYLSLQNPIPPKQRKSSGIVAVRRPNDFPLRTSSKRGAYPIVINLQGTRATIFEHHEGAWPSHGRLHILGLIYNRIGTKGPFFVQNFRSRGWPHNILSLIRRNGHPGLHYLSRQAPIESVFTTPLEKERGAGPETENPRKENAATLMISTQPYLIAAAALREGGQDRAATMVEHERLIISALDYPPLPRFFVRATSWFTGFGYKLSRFALLVIISFILSTVLVAYSGLGASLAGWTDYAGLTADLFIPLLEIPGYESVSKATPDGELPNRVIAGMIATTGWLLSAVFAITVPPRLYALFQRREVWRPNKG